MRFDGRVDSRCSVQVSTDQRSKELAQTSKQVPVWVAVFSLLAFVNVPDTLSAYGSCPCQPIIFLLVSAARLRLPQASASPAHLASLSLQCAQIVSVLLTCLDRPYIRYHAKSRDNLAMSLAKFVEVSRYSVFCAVLRQPC
jgi:hypothetical protein